MNMKNLVIAGLAVGALLASQPRTGNAATYSITGSEDGFSVDLNITTSNTLDANGGYDITGLTGTIQSFGAVTLWINPNQPDLYTIPHSDPNTGHQSGGADLNGEDNVWYPTAPYLLNGVGFQTTGYAFGKNFAGALWGTGPGFYGFWIGDGSNVAGEGIDVAGYGGEGDALTVTATPLPSTWSMLIAGFVGLGFLVFRGTNKRSAALAAA
jgi:hypothetical protein